MFIIPKPNFTRVEGGGGGESIFHMEEVGGVHIVWGGQVLIIDS